ncbi:protein lethal(2)essential for life-like [Armigeres subalbatus]|uniref:protein lethal(2)essential for life-like n=1 Tax=Armigeres subalbatus TaxID=124917 RepID=UPI002ED027FF
MALIPILFSDWWDDSWDSQPRLPRVLDQHFGSGICRNDLLTARAAAQSAIQNQRRSQYVRPWRNFNLVPLRDSGSAINVTSDKFQINLDVQHFAPEEVTVKATDNSIIVEGKHEEKQDEHGQISRHFVRRYKLPVGHDASQIVSSLSSDGILTISAPKKALPEPEGLRTIPIVQTGQPKSQPNEKSEAQANNNIDEKK